jgi:putative MFS transporter
VGSAKRYIDDAPFGRFHRRLTIYSCGGPFCDGYILGIIAIALSPLSRDLGLSPNWEGLVAAATLVGMCIGSAVFGYLTDRIGRQVMYTADLLVLVLASAAQYWVEAGWTLFALRLVLGIAVGADYPIATALLSEFAPKRQRGMLMSTMIGAWWFGYTVSFIAGYLLTDDQSVTWRWMLASSAVPAVIVSLLRWGTPESPRWLLSKGRDQEARAIVLKHLGPGYDIQAPVTQARVKWRAIFQGEYGRRTLFVALFWTCHNIPAFAIYTFAPDVLHALGATDPALSAAVLSVFFLVGVFPAIFLIDRIGRRPVLIVPYAVNGVMMVLLAVLPDGATTLKALCFIVFAMLSAGSSVLQWVYPSELFPTDVRASALGVATSISRIGAAVGTFLFPIGLARLGVSKVMLSVAVICFLGWVIALVAAPETRGLSLDEASGAAGVV